MKIDNVKLYALADTLRLQLLARGGKIESVGKLSWTSPWGTRLSIGDKFEGTTVNGYPHALLRVAGDMWLYASVFGRDDGVLTVLDASKSPVTLPKTIVENWEAARSHFKQAATAVYRRSGRGRWRTLEEKPANP